MKKVGTIVKGKTDREVEGVTKGKLKYYMPGSINFQSLLAHRVGLFAATSDTIELWDPNDVYGMIVKINKDIFGYGPLLANVLLENRTVWFLLEDLEVVKPPDKTT